MDIIQSIEKRNNLQEIEHLAYNYYADHYSHSIDFFSTDKIFPNILKALPLLDLTRCNNPILYYGIKHGVLLLEHIPKDCFSVILLSHLAMIGYLKDIPLSTCLFQSMEHFDLDTVRQLMTHVEGMCQKIQTEWDSLTDKERHLITSAYRNHPTAIPVSLQKFLSEKNPSFDQRHQVIFESLQPQEWLQHINQLSIDDQQRIKCQSLFYPYAHWDVRSLEGLPDLPYDTLSSDIDIYYAQKTESIPYLRTTHRRNHEYSFKNVYDAIANLYILGFLRFSVHSFLESVDITSYHSLAELLDNAIEQHGFDDKKCFYSNILSYFETKKTQDILILGFSNFNDDLSSFSELNFQEQMEFYHTHVKKPEIAEIAIL